MPLPRISPPHAVATARHLFLAHAGRDHALAGRLVQALRAWAGDRPQSGIAPERIFASLSDREQWDDEMQQALQQADMFLLLVSPDGLHSPGCMRALEVAARLGAIIVPVLARPTPLWADRPIPFDPHGRQLGALQAAPLDPRDGCPWAIEEGRWQSVDHALHAAVAQIGAALERHFAVTAAAEDLPRVPVPRPLQPSPAAAPPASADASWDVFISHASEDKAAFVTPLAEALRARGLRVWYDDITLKLGDSLRRSIDRGLAQSRFGIVVLSKAFLAKEWPQRELDALMAREVDGDKVVLPVWHGITEAEVRRHSPLLADRLAVPSSRGVEVVVARLLEVIQPS